MQTSSRDWAQVLAWTSRDRILAVSPRVLNELEPVPIDMFGTAWDGDQGYELSPTAAGTKASRCRIPQCLASAQRLTTHSRLASTRFGRASISWPPRCARTRSDSERAGARSRIAEVGNRGLQLPRRGLLVSCPRMRAHGVTVTAITRPTNPPDVDSYESSCVLRASPHIFNTDDDLAALVAAL